MNRTLSLGMVVLSPVAGTLNAIGGMMVVGFLAQDQIALLGDAFAGVWGDGSASLTALAVAVLLGFSGGLFSRIAVAGTAPLLGAGKDDAGPRPDVTLVSPDGDGVSPDSPNSSDSPVPPSVASERPPRNGHGDRSSARRVGTVLVGERRTRER